MDIQLPDMDGLEATRRLKVDPLLRNIPVVAVTSFAMTGDHERAMAAGCIGYITKPIDKTTFIGEIASHLVEGDRVWNRR
jgi:CheY-like chemotaxis protein